jgi:hypothetical protein
VSAVETCRHCGDEVTVMAQKGTGLCGQRCTKVERHEKAALPVRNEPECAVPE